MGVLANWQAGYLHFLLLILFILDSALIAEIMKLIVPVFHDYNEPFIPRYQ